MNTPRMSAVTAATETLISAVSEAPTTGRARKVMTGGAVGCNGGHRDEMSGVGWMRRGLPG
jgi:hypothetical protein